MGSLTTYIDLLSGKQLDTPTAWIPARPVASVSRTLLLSVGCWMSSERNKSAAASKTSRGSGPAKSTWNNLEPHKIQHSHNWDSVSPDSFRLKLAITFLDFSSPSNTALFNLSILKFPHFFHSNFMQFHSPPKTSQQFPFPSIQNNTNHVPTMFPPLPHLDPQIPSSLAAPVGAAIQRRHLQHQPLQRDPPHRVARAAARRLCQTA